MENDIKYSLVPVNIIADSVEKVEIPLANERKIMKMGQPIYFSIKDIEDNLAANAKTRKETLAKLEYEVARKENIEHHHPFVLDFTAEQLYTIHMYKEACSWVDICNKKIEGLDDQDKIDNDELAEVRKQIPELALIESPFTPDEQNA